MFRLNKMIITVVAIISIVCCTISVYAVDTEPVTQPVTQSTSIITELVTEQPSEQSTDIHAGLCFIIGGIGILIGYRLAQGFSFWKW